MKDDTKDAIRFTCLILMYGLYGLIVTSIPFMFYRPKVQCL